MQRVAAAADLRAQVSALRAAGKRLAFVPTMGNLHAGHLELVRRARHAADAVVVSVFVNPMQFSPDEDFDTYPRTLDADAALLENAAVELLFAPDDTVIYPQGAAAASRVVVPGVGEGLEAAFRPGFFVGVATVVARLFNLVQPDIAVFGEKDYQQLAVIRAMTRDLCWPIDILGVPTVREADGLALSSRNQYLSGTERALAPLLHRVLERVAGQIRAASPHYGALEDEAAHALSVQGFAPDYVAIRHADTLQPVTEGETRCVVLGAARLGRARLIDNVIV